MRWTSDCLEITGKSFADAFDTRYILVIVAVLMVLEYIIQHNGDVLNTLYSFRSNPN